MGLTGFAVKPEAAYDIEYWSIKTIHKTTTSHLRDSQNDSLLIWVTSVSYDNDNDNDVNDNNGDDDYDDDDDDDDDDDAWNTLGTVISLTC
ncbi:hypothetical protein HZH68_007258 [Vespula germanica]|uniref:Uncharacterized protein n=1 Tax=Vespula germanica TaxID=30212 RepID=A0A834K779_VESGE|nr:hypothetical protein HZH68_007258 [Vespula germanica]